MREGDEVIAVVPGSTLDHVIFFADDGTAYTMRDQRGAGQLRLRRTDRQVFRLADQVKIIAAATTDERFVPHRSPLGREGQG